MDGCIGQRIAWPQMSPLNGHNIAGKGFFKGKKAFGIGPEKRKGNILAIGQGKPLMIAEVAACEAQKGVALLPVPDNFKDMRLKGCRTRSM